MILLVKVVNLDELLKAYGLTAEDIVNKVKEAITLKR